MEQLIPDYDKIVDFITNIHSSNDERYVILLHRSDLSQTPKQTLVPIKGIHEFLDKEKPIELFYSVGTLRYPFRFKKNKLGQTYVSTDSHSIGAAEEIVIDIDRKKTPFVVESEEMGLLNFDMSVIMEIYRELGFFAKIPTPNKIVCSGRGFHLHYKIETAEFNNVMIKRLYNDLVVQLKSKIEEELEKVKNKCLDLRFPWIQRRNMPAIRLRGAFYENPYVAAAEKMKIDSAVGSIRQLIRVPGSINLKANMMANEAPSVFLTTQETYRMGDLISMIKYGHLPLGKDYQFFDSVQVASKKDFTKFDPTKAIFAQVRLRNFKKGIEHIARTTGNFEGRRQNFLLQAAWLCADAGYGKSSALGYLQSINELFGVQRWTNNVRELEQKVKDGYKYHNKYPRFTDASLKNWAGVSLSDDEKRAFQWENRSRRLKQKEAAIEKLNLKRDVYHDRIVLNMPLSKIMEKHSLSKQTVYNYIKEIMALSITERLILQEQIEKKKENVIFSQPVVEEVNNLHKEQANLLQKMSFLTGILEISDD